MSDYKVYCRAAVGAESARKLGIGVTVVTVTCWNSCAFRGNKVITDDVLVDGVRVGGTMAVTIIEKGVG